MRLVDAGVVDEDIDAPQLFDRRLDQVARSARTEVGRYGDMTLPGKAIDDLVGCGFVCRVVHSDDSSAPAELLAHGTANPSRSTGHQHALPIEVAHSPDDSRAKSAGRSELPEVSWSSVV